MLVVEDATQDEGFKSNPMVTQAPHVRFYAAAPLTPASGDAIGALCVMDTAPRKIAADKLEQLKFLADQVTQTLEQRRHSSGLKAAVEARREQGAAAQRSKRNDRGR